MNPGVNLAVVVRAALERIGNDYTALFKRRDELGEDELQEARDELDARAGTMLGRVCWDHLTAVARSAKGAS